MIKGRQRPRRTAPPALALIIPLITVITIISIIAIITIIVIIIIIITTRPKPAYGRQGLAESWGQDRNQAGMFSGVLNVSLRASSAQLRYNLN